MDQVRIKVDAAALASRADAAEKEIQNVRNRFQRIEQIVERSSSHWEGEANDAHRREYREYKDDIEAVLSRFQENVTDLRLIAGIYRDVKDEAENLSRDLPADVIL